MGKLLAVIVFALAVVVVFAQLPPWSCPVIKPRYPPPQDVNDLSPSDVKVVMAVGDSISAGFAMHTKLLVEGLVEYRGDVFSIGGDKDQVTLPNMLELIRGEPVIGASHGVSLPLDAVKFKDHIVQPFDPKVAHLNAAQSMAKIGDVLNGQIAYLRAQLLTTYKDSVDFNNDWKVLTVLIGANNLCDCSYSDRSTPDAFATQMEQLLQQVYSNIPRVFVNIVTLFNISQVATISQGHPYCEFIHKTFDECPDLASDERAQHMDLFAVQYNQRLFAMAQEWQQKHYSNFTVVVQPFTMNMKIETIDDVSALDCFHPSALADMGMAVGLWNSMLSPPDKKPTSIDPSIRPICPDANSRLM